MQEDLASGMDGRVRN